MKLAKDVFANLMIHHLRAAGEQAPIEYDADEFRLVIGKGNLELHNIYREFLRLPASQHEDLFHAVVTAKQNAVGDIPEDFAGARSSLYPALRSRWYVQCPESDDAHVVLADHLAGMLVYDLPHSMIIVNRTLLTNWGVGFPEAFEIAKDNLRQVVPQYTEDEGLYVVDQGDGYDATRMLLTDFVGQLQVAGDTIAMVPNRESLYVCGSDNQPGLARMAALAMAGFQHERAISALAFRLVNDTWEAWMPPADHPAYGAFRELRLYSYYCDYAAQKADLDERHRATGTDVFTATYGVGQEPDSGALVNCCMWTQNIESLLPETEQVFFYRPTAPGNEPAARGSWEVVQRVVGDRMEPQDMYPPRWRVREFPSDAELRQIQADSGLSISFA